MFVLYSVLMHLLCLPAGGQACLQGRDQSLFFNSNSFDEIVVIIIQLLSSEAR